MNITPSIHPVCHTTLKKAGSSLLALFVLAGLWSRQINRCASGKRSTSTLSSMALSISFALSLGIATSTFAAEKYWSLSCGQTSFWDINCWSATLGGVLDGTAQPLDGDNVYLYNSNSFDLGVLYRNTAYPTAILNSLTINATGIGAMRLSYIYNDNLSTITEIVGDTGTGIVDQTTGTHSVTNSLTLGNAATGSGFFNLSSTGTLSAGTIFVGNAGTGNLDIDTGGSVSTTTGYLGNASGSTGTATVSGTGTIWDNSNQLFVGRYGNGDLTISNNAMVNTLQSYMGRFNGSTGTVLVESGGSWNSNNWHTIGREGTGNLTIQTGGLVYTGTNAYLGHDPGGVGTVLVDGPGSRWTVGNEMYIGGKFAANGGTGGLLVQNSGSVNVTGLLKLWDNGTLTMDGGAVTVGSFDATAALGVFNFNDGTFTVDAGTYNDSNTTLVVDSTGPGDNPTLQLVNGGNANLVEPTIGKFGAGTLNILSGSVVFSAEGPGGDGIRVGSSSGSNGVVTVDGVGSSWSLDATLIVGLGGTGTLNIQNSGLVSSPNMFNSLVIGSSIGSQGVVTVDGTGSSLAMASNLMLVGIDGSGTLNIQDGGVASGGDGYLGYFSAGSGTVSVGGVGSSWNSAGSLYVGGSDTAAGGTGILNANNGGVVDVANLLKIWNSGTVNLNGGTINTGMLDPLDGSFNFTAGALNLTNSDLLVEAGGILGSAISLSSLKSLGVSGATTLNGAGTLILDGGTFSTGSLIDNGGFSFNTGTFNLTGDNLTIGTGGLLGGTVQVGSNQAINVTNTSTVDGNGLLYVNDGTFSAGNLVNNGQVAINGLISDLGGAISNNGLLNGDGRVSAVLTNNAGGEVRVGSGDVLRFSAAGNANSGEINMLGGEVEFTQDLTNMTGGVITGNGTLIADGGLTNQGNIGLSNGTTNVFGDVNNGTGGAIIVSGNGTATFYDDLVHNGSEIRVSSGSAAVFFGAVSGAGSYTGTGSLFFEGDLMPGNSPALIDMGGDMTLGLNATTIMEIAGLTRGSEYDAFDIGGALTLGGELGIELYDLGSGLFAPQLGDSFDLFMAEIIMGDFDLWTLAGLGGGLGWQMDVLADAIGITDVVRLSVVSSTVPLPPSVWLFGAGLLGLIGIARRRKAA